MSPSVTILLLSVDEAHHLAASLPAALAQPGAEVVVVDDACTDATAAVALSHGAGLLRLEERLSYAAAINRAIERTSGDAVLLLNADCVLDPGFLAAALPRLAEPGVGSVACRLLRAGRGSDGAVVPVAGGAAVAGNDAVGDGVGDGGAGSEAAPRSGSVAPAAVDVIDDAPLDAAGMTIDRRRKNSLVGHDRPASEFPRPGETFGADGAAALYRRETLDACALDGGEVLDEDMALWATDADLAWRAQLLGWRCAYEPAAIGHHVRTYSPSTRSTVAEAHRRLQFRNRYLMWVKNETATGLLRDLPLVVAYEIAALGHVLLRERHLLRGYRDALAALPGARRRRRAVQVRRVVSRPPFGLAPRVGGGKSPRGRRFRQA